MSTAKRNAYLDIPDSEGESGEGFDSGNDEPRKGGRQAKRRKILEDEDIDSLASGDEGPALRIEAEGGGGGAGNTQLPNSAPGPSSVDEERRSAEDDQVAITTAPTSAKAKGRHDLPDISKPLLKKNLVVTDAAIKQSGVAYLSKIPPYMKPHKLRSLLSPFGTINRVFLVPEDPKARAKRVRNHGNKKTCYTEGWVEFTRKLDARRACELLNGRTIGGKKSSYYRDDVWSVMYLRGFKWHHLTEQIAQENAERTARLRAEISRTTNENKEFVKNVMDAKMLEGMQAKAAERSQISHGGGNPGEGGPRGGRQFATGRVRSFKQTPLAKQRKDFEEQPEQVARVLSKIF